MRMRRTISVLLAVLLSLGTGTPLSAVAETRPYGIRTMYNMNEDDAMRKVKLNDVYIATFNYYGKPMALPVIKKDMIIAGEDYIPPKVTLSDGTSYYLETSSIKKSIFISKFVNPLYEKYFRENTRFTAFEEIVSGEIIFVQYLDFEVPRQVDTPEEYAEFRDQNPFVTIIENIEYFKHMDQQRYANEGVTGIADISEWGHFGNDFNRLYPKEKLVLERKVTIKEFKDLFERVYPRIYWPVEEVMEKNPNLFLPQFDEDFLNSTEYFNNSEIMVLFILSKDGNIKKVLLTNYIRKDKKMIDLVTGRYIILSNNNYDQKYFDSIGINIRNSNCHSFSPSNMTSIIGGNPTSEEIKFQDLVPKFQTVKTVGELLEVFSYIPEGFEPDYSKFDFSNSPHVDPAWLASRPAPSYIELTIGSKGQDVLAMKQRFLELGYFNTASFNDRFTDKTAETVKQFEKNNGLPVDGIADAGMLGVLFSSIAVGK